MAINVFLGVFIPSEGEPNIWDLPTDYYLHHTNSRVPQPQKSSTRYGEIDRSIDRCTCRQDGTSHSLQCMY